MSRKIPGTILALFSACGWLALDAWLYIFEKTPLRTVTATAVGLSTNPILLAAVVSAVSAYLAARSQRLSHLIDAEEKKIGRSLGHVNLGMLVSRLYEPTIQSFLSVTIPLAGLYLAAHYCGERSALCIVKMSESHYQNLIAIHAGIGAIIIALVIFVAESLRDDEAKDRSRVLLRESWLFPLTISEILVFGFFLWGDVNVLSLVPIVVVGLGAILSLARLIRVLVSRHLFAEKRTKLLVERISHSIRLAVRERIGNNQLLGALGPGKIEIEFNPFARGESDRYVYFDLEKDGIISDVRLDRLKSFALLAEQEVNRKGFSLQSDKTRLSDVDVSGTDGDTRQGGSKKLVTAHLYLLKKFHTEVYADSRAVLCVESKAVDDEAVKRLSKRVKDIFVVGKGDSFSDEVMSEVSSITDQFVAAIRGNQPKKVDELLKTYIKVAETFLEMMNAYGGGYDYEQARKEIGAWPGEEWSWISWLRESVWELLQAMNEVRQKHVATGVAFLPFAIAQRAIDNRDHYVFQTFFDLAPSIYHLSFEMDDTKVAELVRERSYTHVRESAEFFIEPRMKDAKNPAEAKTFGDYAKYTLRVLGTLLKATLDKKDLASFDEAAEVVLRLYRHFQREVAQSRSEYLKSEREFVTDPKELAKIDSRIELAEANEAVMDDLVAKKSEIFFGLATWLLDNMRSRRDDEVLRSFYNSAIQKLPSDLSGLTSLYVSVKAHDVQRFWNWDSWELVADGEVHTIDFPYKLDRFFAVRVLSILASVSAENIGNAALPPSRDLSFMAEPNSSFLKLLDQIESSPSEWLFVLSPEMVAKVPLLKDLLARAAKAQEVLDEKDISARQLSPAKVEEFKKSVIRSFRASAVLRKVLDLNSSLIDESEKTDARPNIEMRGLNQVDSKEAFFEDWHVHYGDWGSQYGDGLGHSEDSELLKKIASAISKADTAQRSEVLDKMIGRLQRERLSAPVILISDDYQLEMDIFRRSDKFAHKWGTERRNTLYDDIEPYIGDLKVGNERVPVFRIGTRDPEMKKTICVISAADFARLHQYPPIGKTVGKSTQFGPFSIEIIDLGNNAEARREIIAQNAPWLKQHPDKDAYLSQRVVIKIFQKVVLEIKNADTGYRLTISDAPTKGAVDDTDE